MTHYPVSWMPTAMLFAASLFYSSVASAEQQFNINISLPSLTCNRGVLASDECVLSGRMNVRADETINGSIRYYCDIRYNYIAGGNDTSAIRFNDRVIHRGEIKVVRGRAKVNLSESVAMKLSREPRQIEITEISCGRE